MATTARIGNRKTWTVNVGAYNGGTHDHSKLFNRDADDQHPMGAIKGLETFADNTNAHMASKENPHGVTADQVGARPDTWMPTAAQVGARPDTWMPTASDVGAAPAGYGLGGTAVRTENWNTTYDNGFYYGMTNAPDGSWWYGYVVRDGADTNRITQTVYRNGIICTRTGTPSDMGVWEYVNPPMTPGVEYRTTERWNGKVVYAQAVDFGSMPNVSYKERYLNDGITGLVRVEGYCKYQNGVDSVPFATVSFIGDISIIGSNTLKVTTTQDASSWTGYPSVYYVKS
jgi:hypothetical protein